MNFEYYVAKKRQAGISLRQAISEVVWTYPELHADYIKRAATGKIDSLEYPTEHFSSFTQAVKSISENERISFGAATLEACKRYPSLHNRFLAEMKGDR